MAGLEAAIALGAGVGLANWLRRGEEQRAGRPGLSDLLGWGHMVAPGVVLQKDGSFLAAWRFRGPDLSASTPEEMNLLSRHVNEALMPFADGWVFHVDAVREPAPGYAPAGAFPDTITRLIDEERRARYESAMARFETRCVLSATYRPDPEAGASARLTDLLVTGGTEPRGWLRELTRFRLSLDVLQDRLDTRLRMQRLGSDELMTHLHLCLTTLRHPVFCPPEGSYLAYLLADQVLVGGARPVLAPGTEQERHLRVVALQAFPTETWPGVLDAIDRQPFAFRWSNRVIPLGRETAHRLIRRQQQQWYRARKSARDLVGTGTRSSTQEQDEKLFEDAHAREMAERSNEALAASSSGEIRFCHFNSLVVIAQPIAAEADRCAAAIVKLVTEHGFTARVETLNALDAFLGTLPGHGSPNVRRPLLSSANIADLLPLTSVWPGAADCPSPFFPPASPALMWADTAGATPFRVNLHQGDVGHSLVVGATGAGKSVLVGMIAAQFRRYPEAQVFVFDKGASFRLLTQAAGGGFHDLAADGGALSFQPLAGTDQPGERAWAEEWLEVLIDQQGLALTPALRASLSRAVALVAAMDRRHRTLSSLLIQLQDESLRQALEPYSGAGPFGMLLDGTEDAVLDGGLHTFEMHRLLDLGDKITVPVLLYLFHRIEQRLDGRPTLVVIEEAWQPLTNGLFAGRIKEWLLTWRKRNAAVVLVTQSLAQLYELPNRHVIIDSCPTRFLLPNAQAATPAAAPLYRDLGLNDAEIQMLARARPKRDYYYRGSSGSRMFELRLGPLALAFLTARQGCSLERTLELAEEVKRTHGPGWPMQWLRELGLGARAAELTVQPGEESCADLSEAARAAS